MTPDEIKALVARAEKAEAERDAAIGAAYEAAAGCCDEYYRIAPTGQEAESLDAQLEHTEERIRALTPADAQRAYDDAILAAEARGMRMAAELYQENHGPAPDYEMRWDVFSEFEKLILARADQHEAKQP